MPDSFLLFRPDHIGDYLLTTPAIHTLKTSFPDNRIVLAAGNWNLPLIQGNPYIDEVMPINLPWMERYASNGWTRTLKEIHSIRRRDFSLMFNLRKALKECLVGRFLGIKERWGFDVSKSRWTNTHCVHYDPGKHIVENYLDLIESCGARRQFSGLEIFLSDEERRVPFEKYNLREPYIVLAPGAGFRPKLWIAGRWRSLAQWLEKMEKWKIVVSGSANEGHICNEIEAGLSGAVLNIAGKVTLRELAAVIGKASFLVTVDSAAMHIGSAMNVPQAALFGPTDPVHWGPYPSKGKSIVVAKKRMKDIALSEVQRAVEKLLG